MRNKVDITRQREINVKTFKLSDEEFDHLTDTLVENLWDKHWTRHFITFGISSHGNVLTVSLLPWWLPKRYACRMVLKAGGDAWGDIADAEYKTYYEFWKD